MAIYLGSLYTRFNECVANTLYSMGCYDMVTHANTSSLQIFLWGQFYALAPKPIAYLATRQGKMPPTRIGHNTMVGKSLTIYQAFSRSNWQRGELQFQTLHLYSLGQFKGLTVLEREQRDISLTIREAIQKGPSLVGNSGTFLASIKTRVTGECCNLQPSAGTEAALLRLGDNNNHVRVGHL